MARLFPPFQRPLFSNQRAKDVLHFEFNGSKETIWATAQGLLDIGLVAKK